MPPNVHCQRDVSTPLKKKRCFNESEFQSSPWVVSPTEANPKPRSHHPSGWAHRDSHRAASCVHGDPGRPRRRPLRPPRRRAPAPPPHPPPARAGRGVLPPVHQRRRRRGARALVRGARRAGAPPGPPLRRLHRRRGRLARGPRRTRARSVRRPPPLPATGNSTAARSIGVCSSQWKNWILAVRAACCPEDLLWFILSK